MPKKRLDRGTLSARVSRKRGQPRRSAKPGDVYRRAALRSFPPFEDGTMFLSDAEYGRYWDAIMSQQDGGAPGWQDFVLALYFAAAMADTGDL